MLHAGPRLLLQQQDHHTPSFHCLALGRRRPRNKAWRLRSLLHLRQLLALLLRTGLLDRCR